MKSLSPMMNRWSALHPALLSVFPFLIFYAQNAGQLYPTDMAVPALIGLAMAGLALLSGLAIWESLHRASLFASLVVFLFFSYGHVFSLVEGATLSGIEVGRHRYALLVWVGLFFAGTFLIHRLGDPTDATEFANVAVTSMVVLSILNIFAVEFLASGNVATPDSSELSSLKHRSTLSEKPDIYYVVPDGYTNSNTLNYIYGFDNDQFLGFLREKGFHVEENGVSNYALSFLSLASSLNMTHLRDLARRMGRHSNDRTTVYNMLKNSRVLRTLQAAGYTSFHFRTVYGPTSTNRFADVNVHCGRWWESELYQSLMKTTLLYPFWSRFLKGQLPSRGEAGRTECKFRHLRTLGKTSDSPIFALAHIVPPHPPLDADGESPWKDRKRYLNRLQDVNQYLKAFVREVIGPNRRPAVVIIQGDHGPKSTGRHPNPLNTPSPSDTLVRERMGILNAYYLPGNCKNQLPDSVTPVNSFRVVLNCYFGTEYDLLPNRSYFSSYEHPYQLTDLTDASRWPSDSLEKTP
jgi:hypothetical protein